MIHVASAGAARNDDVWQDFPPDELAPIETTPEQRREFMIAVLRAARKRAELLIADIDEIGISLKFKMVSAEAAATWADQVGATCLMPTEMNGGLITIDVAAA